MALCLHRHETEDARTGQWAAPAGRALHPARTRRDHQLDHEWLWSVVSGLASVAVPYELRDQPDPGHAGELVLATDRYEAWVLSWPPRTVGEWHEHDAPGAFCVVSGELEEVRASGPHAAGRVSRRFGDGRGHVFAAGDRHRMTNPLGRATTSVHVYTTG